MRSFGARAAGERLARMRASAQWVEGTGPAARTAAAEGPQALTWPKALPFPLD
ncbi:MAG: hypothetical protein KIT17_14565 [Rubrivivax sp.]|nr:hypothetical protein [Rubrivivax sp.]